ncbi:MAG: glycoside hydrolase family 10 protein [Phycisphaerales bacterium JB054]
MHRSNSFAAPSPFAIVLSVAIVLTGILASAAIQGCSSGSPFRTDAAEKRDDTMRGVWVTRWDYRTAVDVEKAIDDAAATGFTDVFWQVRGQADAYYRSSLEPWGEDLFRDRPEATDPGFDPLAVAVARAKQRGVRLHAWVNVYPLWKGKGQPKDSRHAFLRRPDWRLTDDHNQPQPQSDQYVVANPTDPTVQAHIAAVCRDIVSRYAVDGLHLDYVRFVNDGLPEGRIFPADPASIARFYDATGRRSLTSIEDKAAHAAWVRDEITKLVDRIRRDTKRIRPRLELSAAAWRTPTLAREAVLQDSEAWLRDGTVDRVLPMIYTESNADYVRDLKLWVEAARGKPVTPGIGAYKHQATQTLEQIRLSEPADGYCLFAYATIFESANPFEKKDATSVAMREARRRALEAVQRAPVRN